jgi:transposase
MVLQSKTHPETHRMQLKTILNHVEKYKSFVYDEARFVQDGSRQRIEVPIRSRKNSRPLCGECRQPGACYGRLEPRRYEFVPLWGIAVFFVYARRRVKCEQCGVKAEWVPWAEGKQTLTKTYQWFLARWARRLSWKEVAEVFETTWDHVFRSVRYAVLWGIVHRDESGVEAIGVDEVQWQRGHKYLTLVYQIDAGMKRLLWVGRDRTERSLSRFFDLYGAKIEPTLCFVCSDMWRPYLNVIAARASQAVHILDRFHIMKKMNEAIDQVRREEVRRLQADGYEPILKHSRWALLKNPENRTRQQTVKMQELQQYNLKSLRAHLMREDFQRFWEYRSIGWAEKFLQDWCTRTMRSRLEPMKKVARSLRNHQAEILNWFRANGTISAGIVEGMNNKVKLTTRKSYGFRTYKAIEIALYHNLGRLPEPETSHRFC